jgi:hypothetical protein
MILIKLSAKAAANKVEKNNEKARRDSRIVDLMLELKAEYKDKGFEPSTKALTIELSSSHHIKISAKTIAGIVGKSDRWEPIKWVKPKESEIKPKPITQPANYVKFHTCAWS